MNRIRRVDDIFQVLITPYMKVAPDVPLLIGNWDDETMRNFSVINYENLNDAQCEAFNYPDIDWHRIVLNHEHIFVRLRNTIQELLNRYNFKVEFKAELMDGEMFKNTMFNRVERNGERFNLRFTMNDIMSFTIVNPWSKTLHKIAHMLENHREHLARDDLRIRFKRILDNKIILLHGHTELGTIYEIRLVPSTLDQWAQWMQEIGFTKYDYSMSLYKKLIKQQDYVDNNVVVR